VLKVDRVGFEPTASAMPRFAEAGKFNITVAVQYRDVFTFC